MIDITCIKETIDLVELIERDCGAGRKSGAWTMFHCPFHDDRTASLGVKEKHWKCFSCNRFGDAITWMMEFRKLPFKEAALALGGTVTDNLTHQPSPMHYHVPTPPCEAWQDAAKPKIKEWERILWSPVGKLALEYLNKRGLKDDWIRYFHLGLNPAPMHINPEYFGLPMTDGKQMYIPKGIIIPCIIDKVVWYIKIRQPSGVEPKYINIRGGIPAMFNATKSKGADVLIVTEGEFDCILADQEVGDVAGVVTMGAATNDASGWIRYLIGAKIILAAYDNDDAGAKGYKRLAALSPYVAHAPVPRLQATDKDITDFYLSGGALWGWLQNLMEVNGVA